MADSPTEFEKIDGILFGKDGAPHDVLSRQMDRLQDDIDSGAVTSVQAHAIIDDARAHLNEARAELNETSADLQPVLDRLDVDAPRFDGKDFDALPQVERASLADHATGDLADAKGMVFELNMDMEQIYADAGRDMAEARAALPGAEPHIIEAERADYDHLDAVIEVGRDVVGEHFDAMRSVREDMAGHISDGDTRHDASYHAAEAYWAEHQHSQAETTPAHDDAGLVGDA